jgi:fatty-acyl-CoA synthase
MKQFSGVLEAFLNSVQQQPDAAAIYVTTEPGKEITLSNQQLFQLAGSAANFYNHAGIKKNDRILIAAGASPAFFAAYIGAWFMGALPLVIAPVKKNNPGETDRARTEKWADRCAPSLILVPDDTGIEWSKPVTGIQSILSEKTISPRSVQPGDTAHLQGTSGSTSNPKIAVVTHKNIAANVLGIGTAIQHRQEDKLVSWLPFSHDMGLIGLSYALGWQCPFIVADTSVFVQNPFNWLYLIAKHKGSLSPAPNAAFQACARLARLRPPDMLDLSSWRVALCGSEPVSPKTINDFATTFAPFGYRQATMLPVYGLAEATLAVSIPHPDELPVIKHFDKTNLQTKNIAKENNGGAETQTIAHVSLGNAIRGHQIRIVKNDGSLAAENETGEVQVKGPSVIEAYWNDPVETSKLKTNDGYLHTGDTGFIYQGELYISGRIKDILIIGGRNFLPAELEHTALEAANPFGIITVAAVGVYEEKAATEFLHVLVEERKKQNAETKLAAETAIRDAMAAQHQLTGIYIHWLQKGEIPHTTSGKIQRYLCRELAAGTSKKTVA